MDPGVVGKKELLQLYGKVGVKLANERDGKGSRTGLVLCLYE
jgi:hypothetical protein